MRVLLSNQLQKIIKLPVSTFACCFALQNKCAFSAKSWYSLIKTTVIDERLRGNTIAKKLLILPNFKQLRCLTRFDKFTTFRHAGIFFYKLQKLIISLSFPFSPSTYTSSLTFPFTVTIPVICPNNLSFSQHQLL